MQKCYVVVVHGSERKWSRDFPTGATCWFHEMRPYILRKKLYLFLFKTAILKMWIYQIIIMNILAYKWILVVLSKKNKKREFAAIPWISARDTVSRSRSKAEQFRGVQFTRTRPLNTSTPTNVHQLTEKLPGNILLQPRKKCEVRLKGTF